jgi:signal peptidase I
MLVEPQVRARRRVGLISCLAVLALGAALVAAGPLLFRSEYGSVVVASRAMASTLVPGDRVLFRWSAAPHRGDIVLAEPRTWTGDLHVERVIGLPGDTVTCCDERNRIIVNGRPVTEDYVHQDPTLPPFRPFHASVPAGTVFLAGDNRANSFDSRYRGPVALADVRGVAVTDWPFATPFVALPVTNAFTAAGLPDPPAHDTGYVLDITFLLTGGALVLIGLIWLATIGVLTLRGRD